jgi:hypothetical protein
MRRAPTLSPASIATSSAQPGVRYVIVLESINDIGRLHQPNLPGYRLTAEDLEQGLSQLVARAHEHGVKVFGATITPYQGAGYATEKGEQIREAVNTWILTSGIFDGTVDFDKATRDPAPSPGLRAPVRQRRSPPPQRRRLRRHGRLHRPQPLPLTRLKPRQNRPNVRLTPERS